jgi:membrane protein DedA with SNARE-associated domain
MGLLGTLIWILGIVCAVWVIVDVLTKNKKLTTGMKVLWIVLALFFSIITAIVYYFVYMKK